VKEEKEEDTFVVVVVVGFSPLLRVFFSPSFSKSSSFKTESSTRTGAFG
jgi:hypothetical protein